MFKKWLGDEYDLDAASAAIAAAASERLPGDPLWLLIVAGPGSAKTETVQALAGAGAHVTSTIAQRRRAAVRDTAAGAHQESDRRPAAQDRRPRRARYQGRYLASCRPTATRAPACSPPFGKSTTADGSATSAPTAAQTLTWTGRIVIVGAVTTAWDAAHAVVATMGDRFVLMRSATNTGRKKAGRGRSATPAAKSPCGRSSPPSSAVSSATWTPTRHRLSDDEIDRLLKAADIVTMARSAVERDYRGDIDVRARPGNADTVCQAAGAVVARRRRHRHDAGRGRCGWPCAAPATASRRCGAISCSTLPTTPRSPCRRRPQADLQAAATPSAASSRACTCWGCCAVTRPRSRQDGKEYTIWRYRLADDYDEETLRTMADKPAEEGLP